MGSFYVSLAPNTGGGGGGGSSSVTNDSSVPGATVSDALNNLQVTASTDKYKPIPVTTLTSTDISNKYITLPSTPTAPTKTQVIVINGISGEYGTDFIVSGNQLSWAGLNFDGQLSTGDSLIISYT